MKEIKTVDLISQLKNTEFDFLIPLVSFINQNNSLPENYNDYISQIPIRKYHNKSDNDFLVLQTLLLLKKFDTKNTLLSLFKNMTAKNYKNLYYFNLNSSFKNTFLKQIFIKKNSKTINKLIFDERFFDKLPEILYTFYQSKISEETKNSIVEQFIDKNKNFTKNFIIYLLNYSSTWLEPKQYLLYLNKTPDIIHYLSLKKELLLDKYKNNETIISEINREYEKISIKLNLLNF